MRSSAFDTRRSDRDRASIVFAHATGVYVALNLLVSYSMFSIKTASLLWFLFGALSRRNFAAAARPNAAAVPPDRLPQRAPSLAE